MSEATTKLYILSEGGIPCASAYAPSATAALDEAARYFDPAVYDGPTWVDVEAREIDEEGCAIIGGDYASRTIFVDETEPSCAHADGHVWTSPHDVVGGIVENPGVTGHGGGVIIRDVCPRCSVYRVRDTWATNPATGEQGFEATHYEEPDDASLALVHEVVWE